MADPLITPGGLQPISVTRPLRRGGIGGAPAFEASLAGVSNVDAPETAGSTQVDAVNPMLLHELAVDSEERRDREAHRHGTEVLDLLAELQRGLLGTGVDAGAVSRLASLVNQAPNAANPLLAAALRSVLLRARIEIARHATVSLPQD